MIDTDSLLTGEHLDNLEQRVRTLPADVTVTLILVLVGGMNDEELGRALKIETNVARRLMDSALALLAGPCCVDDANRAH